MRIARFVADGDPAYGIVELAADGGPNPDTVSALTGDPISMPVQLSGARHDLAEVRLLAPVIPRSKVVCVGRNYAEHAAEMGGDVTATPLTFFKPNTAVIGPGEAIIRPVFTKELHYEGELAIVIGRICKQVPVGRAEEVIFGYTIGNDVTARDLQGPDKQWARAKGSDTFCPLGPWMATHLTLAEASDLEIRTSVDGAERQRSSTKHMVHGIAELVAYVSSYTTLLPGDVILTGTPAGVGEILPGQQVTVHIEGIGDLTNPVIDDSPEPDTTDGART